jgi:hypothetical protein
MLLMQSVCSLTRARRQGEGSDIRLLRVSPAVLIAAACTPPAAPEAPGITLTARVAVPGAAPAGMLDHANRFNQDVAAVFMFEEAGDLVVSDDIIPDGGVSEANLEVGLATFATVLGQNRNFLLRAAGVIP